jgi:hypothetical protein
VKFRRPRVSWSEFECPASRRATWTRLPPTTLHPSPSGSAKQCDAELVFMPQEERDNRENMTNRGFKPYGTPPPLDLDEYKDSFELWEKQWEIFLVLSTIDTVLDTPARPKYKLNTLLSCISKQTLQIVLTMGLTTAELEDHETVIKKMKERCNAGRNKHVWRQQFAGRKQRPGEAADNWLCDLRTEVFIRNRLLRRMRSYTHPRTNCFWSTR